MSDAQTERIRASSEPQVLLGHTDAAARQLWRLWQRGEQPGVDVFLAQAGELSVAQIVAALRVDMRERWKRGEQVLVESYLESHPALRNHAETFALVYDELLLRQDCGDVSVDDYYRRFPHYAERLRQQTQQSNDSADVTIPPPNRPTPPSAGSAEPGPQSLRQPPAGPEDKQQWFNLESTGEWHERQMRDMTVAGAAAGLRDGGVGSTPAESANAMTIGPEITAPPRRPSLPAQVGKYAIVRELGRGGMGVVYHAHDTQLKRPVALKMILAADYADQEAVRRFRIEAEAVARLKHPNIVQIYEIGEQDGKPYFALEYLDGGSLKDSIAGKPQPPGLAASTIRTLADAIHYAHELGIIHRDLKPGNVLFADNGSPKITDFGLAKLDPSTGPNAQTKLGAKGLTKSGDMIGTPSYMAPEQVEGKKGNVTNVTDVYALGAILYEMLTGQPPFNAPTPMETFFQVLDREPIPPTRLQPKIPRDLATICLKCLQKEPSKRYASGKSLAADLQRFLNGEPILARRAGWVERTWKWTKRRPAIAALIALVFLSVIGGFIGISWQLHETARARDDATSARDEARAEQAKTARALEQSEESLYFGLISQARLEWRANNVAGAEILLDKCQPERRGWEWHYLKGLNHTDLLTVHIDQPQVRSIAFSPNGERLLIACSNPYYVLNDKSYPNDLHLLDPFAARVVRSIKQLHAHEIRRVAYSPDGSRYATASHDGAVKIWDADKGLLLVVCRTEARADSVSFSPSGDVVAIASSQVHTVSQWDVTTGKQLQPPMRHKHQVFDVAYSPDGRFLASTGFDGTRIWEAKSQQEVRHIESGHRSVCWSPDGRFLATSGGAMIKLWQVETGQLAESFGGWGGEVTQVRYSPDGRYLATASTDRTVRLWDARSGQEIRVFRGHEGRVECISFHPNGRYLASGSAQPAEIKLWDVTRLPENDLVQVAHEQRNALAVDSRLVWEGTGWGETGLRLRGDDFATERLIVDYNLPSDGDWRVPSRRLVFSGDHSRLAGVSLANKNQVCVWDAVSGKELLKTPPMPGRIHHVAFSDDGRRFAAMAWCGGPKLIRVWDAADGKTLADFDATGENPLYGSIALNGDGTLVAFDDVAKGWAVQLADVNEHQLVGAFPVPNAPLVALAFDHKQPHLAGADMTGAIHLWDVKAKVNALAEPMQAETAQYQLAFAPDGKRLASVDRERVKLWDVASGREILVLRGAPARPSDNGYNPQVCWSPDGTKLAATNWNESTSIWDAADRNSPAAKAALRHDAELRAFEWHLRGATEGMNRNEPALLDFHSKALDGLTPTTQRQYMERAKLRLRLAAAAPAQADLDKAMANNPDRARLVHEWAALHFELGNWTESAALYRQLHEIGPQSSIEEWGDIAGVLLLSGDEAGHRRLCNELVQRFDTKGNRTLAGWGARFCTLSREPPLAAAEVIKMAHAAVAEQRDRYRLHTLGMAYYRAGQFEDAAKFLSESRKMTTEKDPLNDYGLCLAYRRLGRDAESRAALAAAEEWMRLATGDKPDRASLPPHCSYHDWLEVQLLRREVRAGGP